MKQYIDEWMSILRRRATDSELREICRNIIIDDTGDTDELSMLLACEIVRLMEDNHGVN